MLQVVCRKTWQETKVCGGQNFTVAVLTFSKPGGVSLGVCLTVGESVESAQDSVMIRQREQDLQSSKAFELQQHCL